MSDVLDRIAKLFALADEGSGATDGERDAAVAAAQRLMTRYRIDEAEARAHAGDYGRRRLADGIIVEDVGSFASGAFWRYDLLHAIGQIVTVDAVYVEDPPGVRNTSLVGRDESVRYVRLVYGWIAPQVEREASVLVDAEARARKFLATARRRSGDYDGDPFVTLDGILGTSGLIGSWSPRPRSDEDDEAQLRRYAESVYTGAVLAVYERLQAAHLAEAGTKGTDLVRYERAALDDFYGDDRPEQRDDTRTVDPAAASAGYGVGQRVDLDPTNKVEDGPGRYLDA